MINESKWISEATQVKNENFPFGLGWDVHVVTDYPGARPQHFKPTQRLVAMLKDMTGRDLTGINAMCIEHEATQSYVIVVLRQGSDGMDVTVGRLIELITHECSHVADLMFRRPEVHPCTETRAYTMDWLVGMAGNAVLPNLWENKTLTHVG